MKVQSQILSSTCAAKAFTFSGKPRRFPVVDALPLLWPRSAAAASELIDEWRERAGRALAEHSLSKTTMLSIASHTSRKTGCCKLSNQSLSARSGRKIDATKKDIARLKRMGFLIAEIDVTNGYRSRTRSLFLAIPDRLDEDTRMPLNDDTRVPPAEDHAWGYTCPPHVYPIDQGERRNV